MSMNPTDQEFEVLEKYWWQNDLFMGPLKENNGCWSGRACEEDQQFEKSWVSELYEAFYLKYLKSYVPFNWKSLNILIKGSNK